ncbi:MAG: hypothetical protein KDA60_10205, partial [Planctomycetales bacterium]|nr:hypothetical protein [Planctomycetales bacterium]
GPITQWSAHGRLITELLRLTIGGETRNDDAASGARQVSHLGFHDLSGQLRAALEQYAGVRLIPFSLIGLLAAGYILLIGPADYFVLRHFRRMSWTWLTFPLIIGLFCAISIYLATQWKGREVRVNQVDLVDYDLHRGLIRGTTWCHLFSPRDATYDVSLTVRQDQLPEAETDRARAEMILSWHGLPGGDFGGMDTELSTGAELEPYRLMYTATHMAFGPRILQTQIERVPLPIWSSRAFQGRWTRKAPDGLGMDIQATPAAYLEGRVHNPFPFRIHGAKLLFGRWYYSLGELDAHETFDLDASRPESLRNWLTRKELIDGRDISTPWDRASLDVPRIMEMLMFYDYAGGYTYTELNHRFQPWLDMSNHLANGRAILLARTDQQLTDTSLNGELPSDDAMQRWTFVRVVCPVASTRDGSVE